VRGAHAAVLRLHSQGLSCCAACARFLPA
jgi:hypothetical protein